jgi:hypothetical protein
VRVAEETSARASTLRGTYVIENADHPLDADTAMLLILGLIPESERARVEAIADGDQALVSVGLGQWLGRCLGPDLDAPMQEAARCDAEEEADGVVRAYWRWLRDRVSTVHLVDRVVESRRHSLRPTDRYQRCG